MTRESSLPQVRLCGFTESPHNGNPAWAIALLSVSAANARPSSLSCITGYKSWQDDEAGFTGCAYQGG